MARLVGRVNKNYVYVSNRVTSSYENTYGLRCDLYFPVNHNYDETYKYQKVNLFTPHELPEYHEDPDVKGVLFYIPLLYKKEFMNSPEDEFDSFYLEDEPRRPFIETSKKRELPICTKVVVHLEETVMKFWVDKKTVKAGANGFFILRMGLSPLSEDKGGYNF